MTCETLTKIKPLKEYTKILNLLFILALQSAVFLSCFFAHFHSLVQLSGENWFCPAIDWFCADMDQIVENFGNKLVHLTEEEEKGVIVKTPFGLEDHNRSGTFLVGKLLTKKDYNFRAFCSVMNMALNPQHGVEIAKSDGDRLLFRFFHDSDKQKLLCEGPWAFEKNLLVVAEVPQNMNANQVVLDWCSFHVRIHDLPMVMQTKEVAEAIGKRIGVFECVDGNWGLDMGVRVRLNVLRPLLRYMKVRGTNGSEILVRFTYERLPNYCYSCGLIGHIVKDCEARGENEGKIDADNMPYGPSLRAVQENRQFFRAPPLNKKQPDSGRRAEAAWWRKAADTEEPKCAKSVHRGPQATSQTYPYRI